MGFLDDLKRQADALKTQQTIDTAALARNAALVEGACRSVLQYFMELAQQLNVLQPTPPLRILLDKANTIDGLKRCDFRVDARRKQHRGQEVFDHVVLHGLQKTSRKLSMSKDFPPEIERLESRLRQAGISPDTQWVRDQQSGRLEEVRFTFTADITMMVRVLPNHDEGHLRFQIANFDALETVTADFPAHLVGSELLDQLARWVVGEPNQFLKQAESVRRTEA
ncbi:MAG TPA: hypothetical protein VFL64_07240 [Rhizobacter sp.]|nr:hypothetical protein [Rhizobacter sp.]